MHVQERALLVCGDEAQPGRIARNSTLNLYARAADNRDLDDHLRRCLAGSDHPQHYFRSFRILGNAFQQVRDGHGDLACAIELSDLGHECGRDGGGGLRRRGRRPHDRCSAPPLFRVHLIEAQARLRRDDFDEHMSRASRQGQRVQSLPDACLLPLVRVAIASRVGAEAELTRQVRHAIPVCSANKIPCSVA